MHVALCAQVGVVSAASKAANDETMLKQMANELRCANERNRTAEKAGQEQEQELRCANERTRTAEKAGQEQEQELAATTAALQTLTVDTWELNKQDTQTCASLDKVRRSRCSRAARRMGRQHGAV